MLKLEERTTEFADTLQSAASMFNGWKSDHVKLVSKVASTSEAMSRSEKDVAQLRVEVASKSQNHDKLVSKVASTSEAMSRLEKDMAQLRVQVASNSQKSLHHRSRSPIFRGHGKQHVRKGDIVWLCPRPGGKPTLKRYVVATNGRFSELSYDKAGKLPHGRSVRNEDLFVQRPCR